MEYTHLNVAGRISYFFAVNRPLSVLLLFVFVVFGLASFALTPKQYNPEITRPAFAVTITYDGATREGALNRVVYELVEKINTIPGVDEVHTRVVDGAMINTTVIFDVGHDVARAKLDLFAQLEQHSYLARGRIAPPDVLEINPETIPILQIAFGSEALSVPELREHVVRLSHELGRASGVSEIAVVGGYEEALVVEIDSVRMKEQGVTIGELSDVLEASQLRVVSGGLGAAPYAVDLVYEGVSATPDSVGTLSVAPGTLVRDVAQVYRGVSGERSYVRYASQDGVGEIVMLSVAKVEGASAPVVSRAVLETLELLQTYPAFADLDYMVIGDDGATASAEISGLSKNLLTSIAVVALVLLLFLSTRAALVVLVAIPLTLLVVFGLGLLFDQTINRITLFALILSLGLLVDSAIVATENIYSHLQQVRSGGGRDARARAIATAINEVGVGLLLSTITSVIVFLPMNFITGMMGPYMGPIAFFVPAALIVSFVVAIVVTPFVASYVFSDVSLNTRPGVLSRGMAQLTAWYGRVLRSILANTRKQQILLRTALGVFVLSLLLPAAALVHFQMLPRADRDQFYVYLDLPHGTGREATVTTAEALAELALGEPHVVHVQTFVATAPILDFNGMFKGAQQRSGAEQATMRVNLVPANSRAESSTDIVTALRGRIATTLPDIASAVRLMEEPPGPPVQATFVAKVSSDEPEAQRNAATALRAGLQHVRGVVDVYQSDDARVGRVHYEFDEAAAAALGVSPTAVAEAVRMLSGAQEVAEFLGADATEYTPIVVGLPAFVRESPEVIDTLFVRGGGGEMVSLRSVVRVSHKVRPSTVYVEDVEQLSYVTAEVEGRSIIYVVIDAMRALVRGDVEGYSVARWNLGGMELAGPRGETVRIAWGGEWEMTLENFRDLGVAMGVALLLVYAILVAQYRTFSTPAYILVTVPLGLVGILWGFLVLDQGFGIYLTATALIGFIALIGIVVNNAIIFLEYVEQERAKGAEFREALAAAGEARLRPIFLTSLTTILGSLTIASDPVWSGLAWAIVFGLSLSTVLTLVIYPTLLVRFAREEY